MSGTHSGGIHIMHKLPGTGTEHVGLRTFIYTFAPAVLALSAVVVGRFGFGIRIDQLTAEPMSIAQQPPYYGFLSMLGTMSWAAAVGMFLMGACLIYDDLSRREAAFLTASAALTGYLCVDDSFSLHETLLPVLGIPELVTYLAIGIVVVAYGLTFRSLIREGAWLFLLLAICFLGASVVVDAGWELLGRDEGGMTAMFFEDSLKFVGICAWVAFSALSTRGLVRTRLARQRSRAHAAR